MKKKTSSTEKILQVNAKTLNVRQQTSMFGKGIESNGSFSL